jgi:hypothetical protein
MSAISSLGNIYFVYQFIKKLVTPFVETDAYKLGIIDEKGKVLKKRSELTKIAEREAYTLSDTLIFNLKKLLAKIPGGSTKFATFAAALFLIKEEKSINHYLDQDFLFREFYKFLSECKNNSNEVDLLIEDFDRNKNILMEDGLAVGGGHIAGLGVENPNIPNQAEPGKKKRKKFAGAIVFEVDTDRYMKARLGKRKYVRYEKYVGNDEIGEEIRQYALCHPKESIILQDKTSGYMMYLRYGKK